MNNKEEKSARSIRTKAFLDLLNKLPKDAKEQATVAFNKWKEDPSYVGFKPLGQSNNTFWSAKIGDGYRAVAKKMKDDQGKNCYVWTWIGSHENYNNEISRLKASKKVNDVINRMRGDTSQSKNTAKPK
jgi:mRNA-degrading endonuclease RelE of RelBE toxin-antitoxin system